MTSPTDEPSPDDATGVDPYEDAVGVPKGVKFQLKRMSLSLGNVLGLLLEG